MGHRRIALAIAIALSSAAAPAAPEAADGLAPQAQAVLARAFARRYGCDLLAVVEMRVSRRDAALFQRTLHVASKRIDGRVHSTARFQAPAYIRGMGLLTIEQRGGGASDDHFVYLPSLRSIRRISGAQRADAFVGTDLSYEDFENRRIEDYEASWLPEASFQGESVYVIRARPTYDSGYAELHFVVAKSDLAILGARYFKRAGEAPTKLLHAPRAHIHAEAELRIPTRIQVENPARRTRTEVELHGLRVNPVLENGLFTRTALELERPIPGLTSAPGS